MDDLMAPRGLERNIYDSESCFARIIVRKWFSIKLVYDSHFMTLNF